MASHAVAQCARILARPVAVIIVMAAIGCIDPQVNDEDRSEIQGQNGIPAEDGFVNPLSGNIGTTEKNDGDTYYNALDWTEPGVGPNHCGEDWNYESGGNSDYGKPVYATGNGQVVDVGPQGPGWGNIIMIQHYIPNAGHIDYEYITSVYAHLDSHLVHDGENVVRGQQIGTIGDANGLYTAHLHFEMRWNEALGPTANQGYSCPDEQSGTFDPTDFIDAHPPGWN
jgi:murein DD-endopeptidase MepM/ murein hydrolase activator NlpD